MTDETRTTTTTALAETPEGTPPPSEPTSPVRSRRVRILSTVSFACVALAGILLVLYAWRLPPFGSAIESTENALVRGQVTITRQVHFNSAHRLYNPTKSLAWNRKQYGLCTNPHWHGHNYVLEVTVKGQPDPETGYIIDLGEGS